MKPYFWVMTDERRVWFFGDSEREQAGLGCGASTSFEDKNVRFKSRQEAESMIDYAKKNITWIDEFIVWRFYPGGDYCRRNKRVMRRRQKENR